MVAAPLPTVWVPPPLEPDDPRHGSLNAYNNYGCRCERCKAARRADYLAKRDREAADG